jgi:hypothetical protein
MTTRKAKAAPKKPAATKTAPEGAADDREAEEGSSVPSGVPGDRGQSEIDTRGDRKESVSLGQDGWRMHSRVERRDPDPRRQGTTGRRCGRAGG